MAYGFFFLRRTREPGGDPVSAGREKSHSRICHVVTRTFRRFVSKETEIHGQRDKENTS